MIYNFIENKCISEINIYDDSFDEYDFLSDILKNKLLIFFNEDPGIKINYDILYNNILYLHKTVKLKYLVMDVSYTAGEWINYCFANDDMEKLKIILSQSSDHILSSRESYDFLLKLYEYNRNLNKPAEKPMEIVGINPEINKTLTSEYINYLFDLYNNKKKSGIINSAYNYNKDDEYEYYKNMRNSLTSNETAYREYFNNKLYTFKMALNNYFSDERDINEVRAENLVNIYNKSRECYFGQLGDISFIDIMKKTSINISGKIFSMPYFYENCSSSDENIYRHNFNIPNCDEPRVYLINNKILKYFETYREFIYKINKAEYITYDKNHGDKYIILANSSAVTKFESE